MSWICSRICDRRIYIFYSYVCVHVCVAWPEDSLRCCLLISRGSQLCFLRLVLLACEPQISISTQGPIASITSVSLFFFFFFLVGSRNQTAGFCACWQAPTLSSCYFSHGVCILSLRNVKNSFFFFAVSRNVRNLCHCFALRRILNEFSEARRETGSL